MNQMVMKELNTIAQAIYDKKGFNILALDVRSISTLCDYVLIAEGNIDRHLKALSGTIKHAMAELGHKPIYVEGEGSGDWIVMDYSEIMVHLLVPDFREKYSLEQLWTKANLIDLKINTTSSHLKDEANSGFY